MGHSPETVKVGLNQAQFVTPRPACHSAEIFCPRPMPTSNPVELGWVDSSGCEMHKGFGQFSLLLTLLLYGGAEESRGREKGKIALFHLLGPFSQNIF